MFFAFQEDELWMSKWPLIKECLDEVVLGHDLKLDDEPNPETNLCPFMTAATAPTECSYNHLDLVYYLLREDPSVLSHFDTSGEERERGKQCGKRRRLESSDFNCST
jgi:hypothetical protein